MPFSRASERPFQAAELVVGGPQAVPGRPHVVKSRSAILADVLFGDQGAVGGQAHVDPIALARLAISKMSGREGLASGKDEHRHPER